VRSLHPLRGAVDGGEPGSPAPLTDLAPAPRRPSLVLPATGIVLGAAGVVVGVIASFRVRTLNDQVEQAGYGEFTAQSLAQHASRAHRFEGLQLAGYGLGGAALATSIIYLVLGRRDRLSPERAGGVRLTGNLAGGQPSLALAGRF
jgi:hypothetical protein